ncbi:TPA: hypothetical protein N0F65_004681 [Lagenidium giganteum]|uniref:Uncharacterized protein n=1 Tax=Lagenidium giganteum TaxID=4803 RepID=A0AAV2Z0D0_9STRA|nr:TPA: hypothetical protein N0F65_004681 [Lagenidium giganteum]
MYSVKQKSTWSTAAYATRMSIFCGTLTFSMPYALSTAHAPGVFSREKCSYMNDSNEYVWNAK